MFVDRALIQVRSGKGGDGHVSFRRAKYEPKGGPNGGDGGDGGSVVLFGDHNVNTLFTFRGQFHWEAEPGESGRYKQQHGANGQDCVIRVPPGTLIYDDSTNELIADIKPGESVVVAQGGRGGFGNEHFKTSTYQTPMSAQPGEPAIERKLRLELKLIADVGFVGMPNAGKSTLLASLTRATPKIANYPFTTLSPQLGIAELDANRRIVVADIPGLIEGAASGAGLGHDFLRHIERTRVLVHLLDVMPDNEKSPAENYKAIREELSRYSTTLAEKPEIIALNKLDLLPDEKERTAKVKELRLKLKLGRDTEVLPLSGAAKLGTTELLEKLWSILHPRGSEVEGWQASEAEQSS